MNGKIEIIIGGVKYPLKFGMMAAELIGNRALINESVSFVKQFIDIVYAGMFNASHSRGETAKTYEEVEVLIDALDDQDDKDQVYAAVFAAFKESKYGAKVMEGAKKKLEEIASQSQPTGME